MLFPPLHDWLIFWLYFDKQLGPRFNLLTEVNTYALIVE
uniref:Uncharacterized protein n=1 Tax=Rhizophora mucronata TaxID=61149 RepID=A0A2P2J3A2_RHIMU